MKFLLRIFTCLAFVALVLSLASMYVSAETLWFMPFFGLLFTPLLLINIGLAVMWILWKSRFFALPLIAVALNLGTIRTLVRISEPNVEADSSASQIKTLCYNVNLFGSRGLRSATTYAQVADFIVRGKFDIVCLQEFYQNDASQAVPRFVAQTAALQNRHIAFSVENNGHHFGLATLSRYPIVGKGCIEFERTPNSAIYTDLLVGEADTLRVYNVHLQSNRLGWRERSVLLDERFWFDQKGDHSKVLHSIQGKLRKGFAMRAKQVSAVAKHIRCSPYPVLVCGDFNDTPVSFTYHAMRGNLCDAFIDAGRGFMSTYESWLPSFRIDYIFYSDCYRATACYCPNYDLSDHYPLVCVVRPK